MLKIRLVLILHAYRRWTSQLSLKMTPCPTDSGWVRNTCCPYHLVCFTRPGPGSVAKYCQLAKSLIHLTRRYVLLRCVLMHEQGINVSRQSINWLSNTKTFLSVRINWPSSAAGRVHKHNWLSTEELSPRFVVQLTRLVTCMRHHNPALKVRFAAGVYQTFAHWNTFPRSVWPWMVFFSFFALCL
jgi:hypothetical protein